VHRRARSRRLAALTVALGVLAAGCGPAGPDPLASFAGASLTIQARDLTFAPDIATAPANVPLRLILDNKDVGVPHNLHVFQGATDLGKSPTIAGPGLAAIELPALAPGRYQFECTIHPEMIGTIIVASGASAGPSDPAETLPPDDPTPPPDGGTDTPAGS
jgi:plastocyanin